MSESTLRTPARPVRTIAVSALFWFVAIAAGLFETLLVVSGAGDEPVTGAALVVGVAVRLAVFAAAAALVVALLRGSSRARLALTVLLGVLGLLSILVPAVAGLADGQGLLDAFSDDGSLPAVFAVSRIVHVVAVVVATVAMWWPQSRLR